MGSFNPALIIARMTDQMKQIFGNKVEVTIYLTNDQSKTDPNCQAELCTNLLKELTANQEVDTVRFESQEQAFDRYKEIFAAQPELLRAPVRRLKVVLAGGGLVLLGFAMRYQVFSDREYLSRDAHAFEEDNVKRAQHNPRINSLAREIPRGTIFDRTGSYDLGLTLFPLFPVVAFALLCFATLSAGGLAKHQPGAAA